MRILIDECMPRLLRRELLDHDARTVSEMGWSGKRNGELLRIMQQERFEVLLTADQGLRHQQNLAKFGVAAVVIIAGGNRLRDLKPLIPAVEIALLGILPGQVVEIRS